MFASRPVVHPLEVAAPADPVQPAPGVLMKDLPGMPGTPGGLGLRVLQLFFAAISLAAMSSTVDFASVSAFSYLIATTILQCVWSLTVAIVDCLLSDVYEIVGLLLFLPLEMGSHGQRPSLEHAWRQESPS